MELSDYLRILRQRGWIIILLGVLTAGAAYAFTSMQPVEYQASARLLVSPGRTDFGQAQAAKTLLRNYVAWLDSNKRAQLVIDIMQEDMEAGALKSDVAIASDDSSYIIQIDAKHSEGQIAGDIARIWGDLLIQRIDDDNGRQRAEDRVTAELIEDPIPGQIAGPGSSQVKINALAGGVFGALLGVLAIFLLEWIESGIVRRPDDIERILDVPVIGMIPK